MLSYHPPASLQKKSFKSRLRSPQAHGTPCGCVHHRAALWCIYTAEAGVVPRENSPCKGCGNILVCSAVWWVWVSMLIWTHIWSTDATLSRRKNWPPKCRRSKTNGECQKVEEVRLVWKQYCNIFPPIALKCCSEVVKLLLPCHTEPHFLQSDGCGLLRKNKTKQNCNCLKMENPTLCKRSSSLNTDSHLQVASC